jgi:DNA-binding NarL/FixJ family response regulator
MKVLLVDDHPLILSALKAMIENLVPGVVVNAVSSAKEARFTLRVQQDHDLMLLDLQLGDASGFELLTELRQTNPELSVVVLSSSDRASDVIEAIDLGAMGFLPKRMTTEDLADALKLVMAGGIYVPTMSMNPARDADDPPPAAAPAAAPGPADSLPSFEALGITPRQADVLMLLLQGKSNKDIARRLGLSVETIKDHVAAVLRALGVSSRTQAVLAVGQMTQRRRGGR